MNDMRDTNLTAKQPQPETPPLADAPAENHPEPSSTAAERVSLNQLRPRSGSHPPCL